MIKYASQLEVIFRKRTNRVSRSCRIDETYINVKDRRVYYYHAADKYGDIIDFYLGETRDERRTGVFNKAINQHGFLEKVIIDKSGGNSAALETINIRLWLSGYMLFMIEVLAVKYLNNIIEKSHRKVKSKMHQCLGCNSWQRAESTLAGAEL